MRLNQYLVQNKLSATAFRQSKSASQMSLVWKWLNQKCLPSGKHMAQIDHMTDGQVTSADWVAEADDG